MYPADPAPATLPGPTLVQAAATASGGFPAAVLVIVAILVLVLALRAIGEVIDNVGRMVSDMLGWLLAALGAYAAVAVVLIVMIYLLLAGAPGGPEAALLSAAPVAAG